jgi:urease accessory protein
MVIRMRRPPLTGNRNRPIREEPELTRLLQLCSPTLPIGGFSYSQGLEAAVDAGVVSDERTFEDWLRSGIEHQLGANEAPMLALMHRRWNENDTATVCRYNAWFLASRESRELRLETEQMGWSLADLAVKLGWGSDAVQAALREIKPVALPTAFSFAANALEIDVTEAVTGYCFNWTENQIAAAVKTVPIGQVAGQKILYSLHQTIERTALTALATDFDQISTFTPQLAILSARHEIQYSRLFRS